jgi:beta-lactamase regulating signal transducer with metallopeptidase domain
MIQWLFYVLVVSTLLSVAGLMAEQAMRTRRLPTRWVWLAALMLSAALSLAAVPGTLQPVPGTARTPRAQPMDSAAQLLRPTATRIALPELSNTALKSVPSERVFRVGLLLQVAWTALTALTALALIGSGMQVYLRRRRWPLRMVETHCVGVSESVGPAVIGLLRPSIVLPGWVLSRSSAEQRLILAHESSHLQARDPLLLTAALLPLLLLPWNPLLWWQLHRLRHAIEVDCDARVLRAGHELAAYGEALIEVGQRRSRYLGTVAAMSENRTLLEKRIELMSFTSRKSWTLGFAVLSALSLSVALAATQVATPDTSATGLTLDVATLDRYVGHYQLNRQGILTISRQSTQLSARLTAQPTFPIYADSPTEFHWTAVPARLTFSGDASGLATTATIHQNGMDLPATRIDETTAAQFERALADRIATRQPQPGSEAMLRKTVAAMMNHTPNYADMDDALQSVVRNQEPGVTDYLSKLGPAQTVEFRGVADNGADKYLVTHATGKQTQWMIHMGDDRRILVLAVMPSF